MRSVRWALVAIMSFGCSKENCVGDDCDTGVSDDAYEPTDTVSIDVRWTESTNLSISFDGAQRVRFGIVEPGFYEKEDCPDGPYCHELINSGGEFGGVHNLISIRTDTEADRDWNGELDSGQTWLRLQGTENQVWALFSWGGQCLRVGGVNDELFDHYVEYGCPR